MDALDRILASEEAVSPSPGFALGVMDAVAAAADEPAPFPWGRVAIGLAACVVWASSGVWLIEHGALAPLGGPLAQLAGLGTELWYAAAAVALGTAVVRRRTELYP